MTETIAVRFAPATPEAESGKVPVEPVVMPIDKAARRIANGQAEPCLRIQEHLPAVPAAGLRLADAFAELVIRHPNVLRYAEARSVPARIQVKSYLHPPSWVAVASQRRLRQKTGLGLPRSPVPSPWIGSVSVETTPRSAVLHDRELVQTVEEAIGEFVWRHVIHQFFAKHSEGDLLAEGVAESELDDLKRKQIPSGWWTREIVVRLPAGEVWGARRQRRWSDIVVKPASQHDSDAKAALRSGGPATAARDPGCSLTRGLDVKLSVMYLPGSLFSPQ